MDKKKKLLIAGGTLATLLVTYFIFDHFMYVTTDNAQVDGHFVMLAAKVGGYIADVKVVEGQRVKKGDVLAEIDSRLRKYLAPSREHADFRGSQKERC